MIAFSHWTYRSHITRQEWQINADPISNHFAEKDVILRAFKPLAGLQRWVKTLKKAKRRKAKW
jgi:hypothetical protein